MKEINIYSGDEAISRVVFGGGDCAELCSCLPAGCRVFAVIDHKAFDASAFVAGLTGMLRKRGAEVYMIEASEEAKTMDTVLGICGWLMESGADRDAFLLAVGGGITTDMAGFAASIYKRGIRFGYVPTTLLSQVDAAVGGKTGVNFDRYKNMLGLIRQPEFTFVTAEALSSLPLRDFLSGASEMLKSFVIADGGNYAKAVALLTKLYGCTVAGAGILAAADQSAVADTQTVADKQAVLPVMRTCALQTHASAAYLSQAQERWKLQELVEAAVRVKAGIVSRDQFESGERRKLNLGHTFAHAVETLARRKDMDITHGEAVSMGMVLAARLGVRLAMAEPGLDVILADDLKSCGLPVECPFTAEEMSAVMKKDKKAEGGKVHFVVPQAIGDVVVVDLTVSEVCRLLT